MLKYQSGMLRSDLRRKKMNGIHFPRRKRRAADAAKSYLKKKSAFFGIVFCFSDRVFPIIVDFHNYFRKKFVSIKLN
jgi:hypothetical protein